MQEAFQNRFFLETKSSGLGGFVFDKTKEQMSQIFPHKNMGQMFPHRFFSKAVDRRVKKIRKIEGSSDSRRVCTLTGEQAVFQLIPLF